MVYLRSCVVSGGGCFVLQYLVCSAKLMEHLRSIYIRKINCGKNAKKCINICYTLVLYMCLCINFYIYSYDLLSNEPTKNTTR